MNSHKQSSRRSKPQVGDKVQYQGHEYLVKERGPEAYSSKHLLESTTDSHTITVYLGGDGYFRNPKRKGNLVVGDTFGHTYRKYKVLATRVGPRGGRQHRIVRLKTPKALEGLELGILEKHEFEPMWVQMSGMDIKRLK